MGSVFRMVAGMAWPTGGVGATWARSLTGWLRDPRYLRQLLVVPIFPVLFAFTGGTHRLTLGSGVAEPCSCS